MAKNDLLHGSTGLLVMALLSREDMYGYQIIKEMKARSEDRFALQEGSLYPVLHTLEAQKLVASYEGEASGAGARRRGAPAAGLARTGWRRGVGYFWD